MKNNYVNFKLFTLLFLFFLISSLNAQTFINPSNTPGYDAQKASLIGANSTIAYPNVVNSSTYLPIQVLQTINNIAISLNGIPNPNQQSSPSLILKTPNCFIEPDNTYSSLPGNDDGSSTEISLPFTFNMYGSSYTSVYVNNNGNITFNNYLDQFSAYGFPYYGAAIIAPFWADVYTDGGGALAQWKVFPHYMIVSWNGVGYYEGHFDKLNNFELIISDGTDPIIGIGNNVAFYYKDMAWTTGDASNGSGGFGGTPATVGINSGDGVHYVQVGRFDHSGSDYDGPGGNNDGVDYIDNQCFQFNVSNSTNQPPSVSGVPAGNVVNLTVGDAPFTIPLVFIGPEVGQSVTTTINTNGMCNSTTNITDGAVSYANATITAALCNIGTNIITFTATDDYNPTPGVTTVNITVNISTPAAPPCTNPSISTQSTATQTQCINGTFTPITITAIGTGLSYQWYSSTTATNSGGTSLGSANGAQTNSYTPLATLTGTQYYYCIVSGACGTPQNSTVSEAFIVQPLPSPTITGFASACINSTGNVYTTESGMTSYNWNISGGTITAGSTTNAVTVTWTSAGSKTISVNYINGNNCTATSATIKNVTINPLPVPTITGNTLGCINTTGNVYLTEAGMTGYTWNITGGAITSGSTTNTINVTWTSLGAQTLSVNYTNTNTCTAASATVKNITVSQLPVPTISGSANLCNHTTGNVYTTESSMTAYTWNVTGGTITAGAGTNAITVTWNTEGAQTVSVNYANSNGCTAASATVYGVTLKSAPNPVITGSPSDTYIVPKLATYQYSTPLVAGDLYSWSSPKIEGYCSATARNCVNVHFLDPCCVYGQWTISVTETNPTTGCSTIATKLIYITP